MNKKNKNNGKIGSYDSTLGKVRFSLVISLSPSVKLSGNGTWNNVYKVID